MLFANRVVPCSRLITRFAADSRSAEQTIRHCRLAIRAMAGADYRPNAGIARSGLLLRHDQ